MLYVTLHIELELSWPDREMFLDLVSKSWNLEVEP
jgi:hypothetical protein